MIKLTYDMDKVRNIMVHPDVYPHISDDGSPPASDFMPIKDPGIFYLLCKDNAGVFMFVYHNVITVEVHTCILPEYRNASLSYALKAREWVFSNTSFRKIVTYVPDYNRAAVRLAKAAGMKVEGVSEKSYLKDGKVYDRIFLGVSACQEQ